MSTTLPSCIPSPRQANGRVRNTCHGALARFRTPGAKSRAIGGGFGCKGFIWPHSVMSAIASKQVGRPVKLNLTRKQMFSACGHRSETIQKIKLGAGGDGKLSAISHDTLVQTSTVDEFIESCGATTRFLYSCPNVGIAHHEVRVKYCDSNADARSRRKSRDLCARIGPR